MVRRARAAVVRNSSLGERIYEVANDEVFAGEVAEAEAGALGKESSRAVGPAAFHGGGCHRMNDYRL